MVWHVKPVEMELSTVDSRTPTGRSESVNAYKRKHRNVKTVQLSTVKLRKRNRSVSVKENSRQQEKTAEIFI